MSSLSQLFYFVLRNNLHSVRCTSFKCAAQWIFTYVYTNVITNSIKIQNSSFTPEVSSVPSPS